ncbi:Uncharacterized membrane protein [Phaffia rhodozyma]|uniref:Uncharacterized membrane protein n=1 Tax=Phaffia rhodozyma TaxID=264483 RepID=A0A0F7SFY2_PHARH|nr:Uncharacterized membrane protein [Phaffia rhodozyma]
MTTPSTSNGAQALPKRSKNQEPANATGSSSASETADAAGKSSTLWPVRSSSPTPSSLRAVEDVLRAHQTGDPLATKCAADGGVCCKDLKGEDERTLIDPDVVRDVIIGLSDGLTVPFALTAGLSGLGDARLVVLGGLAELIAGAISMGIGGFLASQAELDHFHYLRKQTHARVLRSCGGEMEREVHGVLGSVGVDESISRVVAQSLLQVESEHAEAGDWDENTSGSKAAWWKFGLGKSDPEEGSTLKWSKDIGVTGFLMRFGEGLEETPVSRLYISAITIGLAYFIGGLCPLLPYFFVEDVKHGLIWSSAFTLLVLMAFGVLKTHFTGATGGAGGYVWGAVSTALVGGVAAAAAFGAVRLLEVGV